MDNPLPISSQSNSVPNPNIPSLENPSMKLYSPSQYGFMGFLLSLVPVFIMSFSNSKLISNGELIRKRMRTYLIIFVILILSYFSILAWASITVTKSLTGSLSDNPSAVLNLYTAENQGMPTDEIVKGLMTKEAENAKKILDNSGTIYFILNTLLLIVVVRYTKKNELPVVKDLQEKKLAVLKSMAIPALVGIMFILATLFGSVPVLTMVAKSAIASSPSQLSTPLNVTANKPVITQPKISPTVNKKTDNKIPTKTAFSSCDALPDKLSSCTPYKCQITNPSFPDELITREITGLVDGNCNFIKQIHGEGRMECNLPEDARKSVAQYYKDVAYAESTGTKVKEKFAPNGQVLMNPEMKAISDDQCDILGF